MQGFCAGTNRTNPRNLGWAAGTTIHMVDFMPTLRIEHPITDLATWMSAFSAAADMREQIGVRAEHVRHPVGDPTSIVVDLDFDIAEQAETFLELLRTQIWAVPEPSPALAGTPEATILEDITPPRRQGDGAPAGSPSITAFAAQRTSVLALVACGGDNDTTRAAAPSIDSTDAAAATPTGTPREPPCGVTLAEVQALLPPESGVTENSTQDPGRCNFTWDDDGPRGIDVAIVNGGRSSFQVPAGYEPLDGYGDEAFSSISAGRASAFAFVGDDLYAADAVADGTGATEADLRDLCLQLLELALD